MSSSSLESFFDIPIGEEEDYMYLYAYINDEEPLPSPPPEPMAADRGKRPAGEASGTKRPRSPTSSRENRGGSNDGGDHDHTSEVVAPEGRAGGSNDGGDHDHTSEVAAPGGRVGGRRLWVKPRDREWWDTISNPACPEADFRRAFRMSRATFEVICNELGCAVAKEDTMLRAAIPVRQRIAVCIWRLATGEPLRLVSKRFGLGISTCHKLVLEGCAAIKAVLTNKTMQWPEAPDAAAGVAAAFEAKSGIPNVVGAMYTTHIPIIAPMSRIAAYYNRRHSQRNKKTSYSISVQGVVDATGTFTDVCIGWPGSISDADVLEVSELYKQRGKAGLLKGQWVVGGAEYPLLDWLLVPYTHQNMMSVQHMFNERVDGVRAVARDAFQRLKARWGCLQRRTEVKLLDLPVVLGACCVLHNICERAGDVVDPEIAAYQLFDDEMVAKKPVRSQAAVQARDSIAHSLLQKTSGGGAFPSS